jgi:hypothetical protein
MTIVLVWDLIVALSDHCLASRGSESLRLTDNSFLYFILLLDRVKDFLHHIINPNSALVFSDVPR